MSRRDRTVIRFPGSGSADRDGPRPAMARVRHRLTLFPTEPAAPEPEGFFVDHSWLKRGLELSGTTGMLYLACVIGWSSAEPPPQRRESPAVPTIAGVVAPSDDRPAEIVPIAPDTPNRRLSDEEFREAQARLATLGHEPGPLDGLFGPRTVAAVRRYEIAKGLEPTGRVDAALLERLRREP